MKIFLLLFPCLFLISTFQLNAQESIGYTNSDDFQYLLDYRLPDWSYSNFYISSGGFNANGTYRSDLEERGTGRFDSKQENTNRNLAFGISPRFELYRESEKRTFSLNLISNIRSNFQNANSVYDGPINSRDEELSTRSNNQTFQYTIDLENNLYVSNDLFLITDLFSNIRYDRRFTKTTPEIFTTNEDIIRNRIINFSPTLGIGFGRIRNVTPVIRAIRVNERYKELGNESLSGNEIRNTAYTFTKIQGYQRIRDRFLKDFWEDVDSRLNGKLDQIGAFDLFYLNDVFNENLGSRFEGYEASLNVGYSYLNLLQKEIDKVSNTKDRTITINRTANVELNLDWFKNLNLYHQINIYAESSFLFPLEKRNTDEWVSQVTLDAQWLWNFADRFQLTTNFRNRYLTREPKENPDEEFNNFASQLQSNLFYFIENKIALTAGAGLNYGSTIREMRSTSVTNKQFQWTLSAGISYYFNRNLY